MASKLGYVLLLATALHLSQGEWVQLPSLEPSPTPSTGAPSPQTTPADGSGTNSSKPGVAEHFIGEMQLAHQRLRASLWPHKEEPQTLKDKLKYLSLLRNHILNNIARSMFGLNSEDAGRSLRRQKRGSGWGSGDNTEIGFPSLEVALLTLAFLVFAVFLVNMVLILNGTENLNGRR
ncbi:hypothetical protein B566_EDAN013493 [Ephemera danica]|nr:hypothetical protein B566_EDAN013493 [Ephemera danica]